MIINLFDYAQKIQEAHAIIHGLPVSRKFSDHQLGPVIAELKENEIALAWQEDERHDEAMIAHYERQNAWAAVARQDKEP